MAKHTLSWHKKRAWKEFSRYIRLRDAIKTTGTETHLKCCTCGKLVEALTGSHCADAGHFIPGRHNSVLFSEHGVHGQCKQCNVYKSGNPAQYLVFMQEKYGQEEIDRLLALKHQTVKFTREDYDDLRDKYKGLYEELKS